MVNTLVTRQLRVHILLDTVLYNYRKPFDINTEFTKSHQQSQKIQLHRSCVCAAEAFSQPVMIRRTVKLLVITNGVALADLNELLVVIPGLLLVVDEVISLSWREGEWGFSRTCRLWQKKTTQEIVFLGGWSTNWGDDVIR